MDTVQNQSSWAFVTPSYAGDLERCALLCRSMDAFLTGPWHHYIIVDKPHFNAFKSFAGSRRTVLHTEDVAPGGMRLLFNMRFIGGRSLWWSRDTGLSLGWHLQQMIKVGIAEHVSEEGLAYCDSDTFFLRPFDVGSLTRGGKFRLFRDARRASLESIANPSYTKASLEMLGTQNSAGTYHSYIDNFVTWHRPTVLALCGYLAERFQGKWQRALRHRVQFSEYILYGLFVEEVQKTNPHHFVDNLSLCRTQWHRQAMTSAEIETFCADLPPHVVAVGVQSFAGVDVGLLVREFEKAVLAHG